MPNLPDPDAGTLAGKPASREFSHGFKDVDASGRAALLIREMELVGQDPFTIAYCMRSIEALRLNPGDRLLDAGCGTAHDLTGLIRAVGPEGSVTLFDKSEKMLAQARGRGDEARASGITTELRFDVGDAHNLPYRDQEFSAGRCVRTLMHTEHPARVLAEIVRTVQAGGRVVNLEPDWGTLTIDHPDQRATQAITDCGRDRINNAWIGRALRGLHIDAGLRDIEITPFTRTVTNLATAVEFYNVIERVQQAADLGRITAVDAAQWVDKAREIDAAGKFFCSLTLFMAAGTKPAH